MSAELDNVLADIQKRSWYMQGGTIPIGFAYPPYYSIPECLGPNTMYGVQRFNHNTGYFDKGEERKKAEEYLSTYMKDSRWLRKKIVIWRRLLTIQKKALKKLLDAPLEKEDISKLSKNYLDSAVNAWAAATIIEMYDPWGETILQEKTSRYSLSSEEINIMTQPTKFSFVQQEKIDRLKAARNMTKKSVKEHFKRYYWIETSWQGAKILTEEYFAQLISQSEKDIKMLESDVKDIKLHHSTIKKDQQDIVRKRKFDKETMKVFNFFSELNDWRDERKKEHACKTNHDTWLLMEKIAKHNSISIYLASTVIINDLERWTLSNALIKELHQRMEDDSCFTYNSGKLQKWYGDDARTLKKALEEQLIKQNPKIKGMIAFKGKVQGNVRIVNSINDISKMNKGDVLVSIMTRPELVPAMKKASAIVTDEGGITCHAAIISRELRLPCVVGTQVATRTLCDGDIIEVDADNGIIKVIKKNNG